MGNLQISKIIEHQENKTVTEEQEEKFMNFQELFQMLQIVLVDF